VPDPKPCRRIVVRSEDAATGEAEGEHAGLWTTCRPARVILKDQANGKRTPHVYCGWE